MARNRILVVEDGQEVRVTTAMLLETVGRYKVATAEDGFDALLQLRNGPLPDAIISDLNMPHMSGFELLSVVRRRFPEIPVIAVSGAFDSGNSVPGGVIADAFVSKGGPPAELLRTLAELLRESTSQVERHHRQSAPVWIPRNGKDARGVPYIVLTCVDCLRSFPLSVMQEGVQEIQETPCIFCQTPVRYIVDFSLSVTSPRHSITAEPSTQTKPN